VIWLGNQSQDEVGRLAASADVIAVPSVQDEAGNVDGLPNFALEALASATPVVAARTGGLPQVIDDGVTGVLVASRDARALADGLRAVLRDRARAAAWGRAARDRVQREFGWDRVAERFEIAYDRAAMRDPAVHQRP
jgi:type III pantothenate kinase